MTGPPSTVSFGYPKGQHADRHRRTNGARDARRQPDGSQVVERRDCAGGCRLQLRYFQERRKYWTRKPATTSNSMRMRRRCQGCAALQTLGSMSTLGMAKSMLADAENATRLYTAYFGKLPFSRLALTQQPAGNFGQAWPTLVYMPFTAFMDSTQRYMASGGNMRAATDDILQVCRAARDCPSVVGTHGRLEELPRSVDERRLCRILGVALYPNDFRDEHKFLEFWNNQRDRITLASAPTHGPETLHCRAGHAGLSVE